jgi:hypothetical protein
MSNKNVPKEVRMGSIKSVIWKNETEAGVRYNVTFGRLYRDGKAWKQTDSFGRDDLLLLAKVANETHSWICNQTQDSEHLNREYQPQDSNEVQGSSRR